MLVGRSPESLFDYLRGASAATSWADRPVLLNIPLRRLDSSDVSDNTATSAVREQLAGLGLDAHGVATSLRRVALIDLISSGETMGALIGLLLEWATESGEDLEAVRRRIRVVGITVREKNSPNVWRWRQRSKWAASFRRSALKGVSVPLRLWDYLGNWQKKVARANPPWRWADSEMQRPPREAEHA